MVLTWIFDIGSENQKYFGQRDVFIPPPPPPPTPTSQLEYCTASIEKKDPSPNR